MEPTLRDGDWLLVDPRSVPGVDELVVARGERLLVKRVVASDGALLTLRGDHPAHGEEAVTVAASDVVGRPWFRYWPARRFGRVK